MIPLLISRSATSGQTETERFAAVALLAGAAAAGAAGLVASAAGLVASAGLGASVGLAASAGLGASVGFGASAGFAASVGLGASAGLAGGDVAVGAAAGAQAASRLAVPNSDRRTRDLRDRDVALRIGSLLQWTGSLARPFAG